MTGFAWTERFAGRSRPVLVAFVVAGLFGLIAARGTVVATRGTSSDLSVAHAEFETDNARRADIVDRNGELLATSVAVYSLFADPRAIWDADEVAEKLALVFPDIDRKSLINRLQDRERAFVWVRRGLTPRQRQAVFELGLEGLGFRSESDRVYPRGTQAGHVLGHTNVDGLGQMGIELSMEDKLAAGGEPVQLTLDSRVQFALETELSKAAQKHEALGAAGIVIEARTGDIRGLASWPAFNPNRPGDASEDERLDRATGSVMELGSVFKPLAVAAALDADVLDVSERFDVRAPIVLRGRVITDTHEAAPVMTPATIVAESSNIGTVKIAQRLGASGWQDFLSTLGLFGRVDVELSASARPLLPEAWTDLAIATTSYGHGIAVSPLAFSGAFSSLANNGLRPELRLLATDEPPVFYEVMRPDTAQQTVDMLRSAVTNGTGHRGDVPGYRVAGKTGTAEKPIPGGYAADRNITSFAALFPAGSPEYVVLIVLDDPRMLAGDGGATAAWNAAPTAARVIERIAPLLGVSPVFDQAALDRTSDERSRP